MKKTLLLMGMLLTFFFAFMLNNKAEVPFKSGTEVPRYVLLEGFTASTCGPCYNGNLNLKNVLAQNDAVGGKYTLIKYQTGGPSPGDPYYTQEVGQRGTFYSNQYVPWLYRDGTQNGNTGSFTHTQLLNLQNTPSYVEVTGSYRVVGQTVTSTIIIKPTTNISGGNNLKLFVAIVEKETYKNKKSNGETVFYQVMKKFMPNANGIILGDLTANEVITHELEWEFKGCYRLPANASQAINHTIEHSVEDFKNLEVVAWVQNISTKEVFNSGTAINETILYPVNFNVANGNGTITAQTNCNTITLNSGDKTVSGAAIKFTATPNTYYKVKEWILNGEIVPGHTDNVFTTTLTGEMTVTVAFEKNNKTVNYGVINGNGTLTATVNGKPVNSGDEVEKHSVIEFTAEPANGYIVKEWTLNGVTVADNVTNNYSLVIEDDATVSVEFEKMEGINPNNLLAVGIFPNPFTNELTLKNVEHVRKITITNALGQIVKEEILTGNTTTVISTQNFSTGIFFITLKNTEGYEVTMKIVKN